MKINGNAIRPANVIEHKGGLWKAMRIQHTQPRKGGAYLQVELRNLRDGSKLNERFRASESVERARLEQKDYQYLYADGEMLTSMDTDTYDQVTTNQDLMGDTTIYLQDGIMVQVEFFEEEALGVILPEHVTLTVTDTEPTVKGQSAANSYKPAMLSNGMRCMVPPFVNVDENIIVATENGEYVKRAD